MFSAELVFKLCESIQTHHARLDSSFMMPLGAFICFLTSFVRRLARRYYHFFVAAHPDLKLKFSFICIYRTHWRIYCCVLLLFCCWWKFWA